VGGEIGRVGQGGVRTLRLHALRPLPYAPGGTVQWTTMVYDAIGRTVAVQQPAGSGTATTAYAGNTVTVTDPAGRWKKYTSDALGNLTQVTEPNPQGGANFETYYSYNAAGQMTQVSMPRPNVGLPGTTTQVRTFVYNTSGYLTSATNPENGTTQYFYLASGLLDYKLDAKGQKVKYTYDALERVSKIEPFATASATTPIDCEVVSNNYDQWATAIGRLSSQVWGDKDLTKCAKGEVRYEYLYTATGRVAQKKVVVKQRRQDPLDSNPQTQWKDYEAALPVDYEYTSGLHTKTTYPTTNPHETYWNGSAWVTGFNTMPGHVYNYAYDSQNRPLSATYQTSSIGNPQNMVYGVTYNAFSQMTQMQWLTTPGQPGTSTQQWTYDSLLRLTGIPTMGLAYSYSATADDGKITAMIYTAAGYSVNYAYDSLGRLASANTNGNQWGLSYLYDGFGNRLQQNVTKAGPGYTPPSSNLFVDPATNRVNSWTYDANGNATNIPGVGSVGFDWANRVTTVGSETYGYDPGNKRLWKNAQLTFWGGRGEEIGRFELQWLQDGQWALKFKQISTLRYFAGRKLHQADRLGSANGTFYPYGEEITSWAPNPADKFGTYHRDGTGLDYADQRFYHPSSGRFVTTDPLPTSSTARTPGSLNRYLYAGAEPANVVDVDGRAPCPVDWCTEGTTTSPSGTPGPGGTGSSGGSGSPGFELPDTGTSQDGPPADLRSGPSTTLRVRGLAAGALNGLSEQCESDLTTLELDLPGNGPGPRQTILDALVGAAQRTTFYDVSTEEGNMTLTSVLANYGVEKDERTLAAVLASSGKEGATLTVSARAVPVVLLDSGHKGLAGRPLDSTYGRSLILHELTHVVFRAMTSPETGHRQIAAALRLGSLRDEEQASQAISDYFAECLSR